MRLLHVFPYLATLMWGILEGSWNVVRSAVTPGGVARPGIFELPMRCMTDLEISVFASSITITPGTLVLGVAASDSDVPATLFVHSLYDNDRERVTAGLRHLEDRVLAMLRKKERP